MTRLRDPRNAEPALPEGPASAGPEGGSLPRLRRAAEDLLRAGDRAIDRVLSGDSEAFLRANVQQSGE